MAIVILAFDYNLSMKKDLDPKGFAEDLVNDKIQCYHLIHIANT